MKVKLDDGRTRYSIKTIDETLSFDKVRKLPQVALLRASAWCHKIMETHTDILAHPETVVKG